MKLYHASFKLRVLLKFHELFPGRKLNVLRSFGQIDSEQTDFCIKHKEKVGSLILDSGTWTLNNAKGDMRKRITKGNYIDYLEEVAKYFDLYFNFDSNFTDAGYEENYYNQLVLEAAGLNPVPVVHDIYGTEIDDYIRKGRYKYVALGSSQMTNVEAMDHVMAKFQGTGIKVHLFGNTTFNFLANYPIYSCDSAMWAREGGYGHIKYWNPKKPGADKSDRIYMEEYMGQDQQAKLTFLNYAYREDLENFLFDTLGVTYGDLMGPDGTFYKQLVNTYFFTKLEDIVNQIHLKKGFNTIGDDEN